jgi:hypothetical protein
MAATAMLLLDELYKKSNNYNKKIEEFCFLGYVLVLSGESHPTFRRNMSPQSLGSKSKPSNKPTRSRKNSVCYLTHADVLIGLFFDLKDRDMFLRNVD